MSTGIRISLDYAANVCAALIEVWGVVKHDEDIAPLDPLAVARQLGRHGVGCELNPEYVELAKVRIGKAEKPHTFQDTREEDAPLFGTLREVGT